MQQDKVLLLFAVALMLVTPAFCVVQNDADDDICGPSAVQADLSLSQMSVTDLTVTGGTGIVLRMGSSDSTIYDRTGTVSIILDGSPEICTLEITIAFNSDYFTPTGYVSTGLLELTDAEITSNVCRLEFKSPYDGVNITSPGEVITISYEFSESASCGMYPVFLDVLNASSVSGPVSVECVSGIVMVKGDPGDINGDGKVSLADSLELQTVMSVQQRKTVGSTDLNNDGIIDSKDSLLLKKYLAAWDVELERSYSTGSNTVSVLGHFVGGIGYGPFYVNSEDVFAVLMDGDVSSYSHDTGDTYRIDLRSGTGLVIKDGSSKSSEERAITYSMNGGNYDSSMPIVYRPGAVTDLGCPTNDDSSMMFMGWYADPEFKNLVLCVPSSCSTDLHLYALWDDTILGHGFMMDYAMDVGSNGYVYDQSYDAIGTLETTYWAYDQAKGYLVRSTTVVELEDGSTNTTEDLDWHSPDTTDTVTDEGTIRMSIDDWTFDTHMITTISSDGKVLENQYYIYGWVPVIIEVTSTERNNEYSAVFILSDILSFDVSEVCEVKVFTGQGITASESVSIHTGGSVTLTAKASSGSAFGGWYDVDGNLISSGKTIILDKILSDTTLIAKNAEPYDMYYKRGETVRASSSDDEAVWTMINLDTNTVLKQHVGASFAYIGNDCGYCMLLESGTGEDSVAFNHAWFLIMNGSLMKHYEWTSPSGSEQWIDLCIAYDDFLEYRASDINRRPGILNPPIEYVTYDDITVVTLADIMESKTSGMSDMAVANYVLSFVQGGIPYRLDSFSMHTEEYWKYPVETLYDGEGDCEDTAILYCAIMKAMGYDTVLMTFKGHAASGINIVDMGYSNDDVLVKSYTTNNVTKYYYMLNDPVLGSMYVYAEEGGNPTNFYFYCETTGEGWKVGNVPSNSTYPIYDNYSSYNVVRVVRVL